MNKYPYTKCGLPYVWLEDGFEIHETKHGTGVTIAEADQLHKVIASVIITSSNSIRGQEIRFLRSALGIPQKSLGKLLGVTRDAIAKYEDTKTKPVPTPVDRLIRYVYAEVKEYPGRQQRFCDIFERMEETAFHEIVMSRKSGKWKADYRSMDY